MQKKTIFILQDTKELCEELTKKLSEEDGVEVVGSATDGTYS